MIEVLKKANELVETLQLRIRKYEKSKSDADNLQGKANDIISTTKALDIQLQGKAKELTSRENKIGALEDLAALEKRVKGGQTALATEIEAFNKRVDEGKVSLEETKKAVEARKSKLQAAEQALDKERREYKERIRGEFVKTGWTPPEHLR